MWHYDFEWITEFDDAAFEAYYETVKHIIRPDVSGVGFRVFQQGINKFRAPLLLTEVRLLLYSAEMTKTAVNSAVSAIGTVRHNTWSKESPDRAFESFRLPRISPPNSTPLRPKFPLPPIRWPNTLRLGNSNFDSDNSVYSGRALVKILSSTNETKICDPSKLFSPRDVLGLAPDSSRGDGIKIAIIDAGIEATGSVKIAARLSLTDAQHNIRHGTEVLSLLAGTEFSIAPSADYYIANTAPTPKLAPSLVAMLWAAHQHVDIISLSLGLPQRNGLPEPIRRVVKYCADHGCQIIASTGNYNGDLCSGLAIAHEVIAVGAQYADGKLRVSQMTGVVKTDCVCLGERIKSKAYLDKKSVCEFSGSSAATPIVAGCYAIFLQSTSKRTDSRELFLQHCCTAISNSAPDYSGRGVVTFPK
jgi:hypothetical protein